MNPTRSPFEDRETFDLFICGHYLRVNKAGLPDPRSAEGVAHYEVWRKAFVEDGVSSVDADRASEVIARRPPIPYDHLHSLLVAADNARRERLARTKPTTTAETPDPEWDEAVRRWESLTDDQRDTRLRRIARQFPDVARFRGVLTAKAIQSLISTPMARAER